MAPLSQELEPPANPGRFILISADYFAMLGSELRGEAYSNTAHRRALLSLIKRSEGAIEFRDKNISAVLQELGLPWIAGYKPCSNDQSALLDSIEAYLDTRPRRIDF